MTATDVQELEGVVDYKCNVVVENLSTQNLCFLL